MNFNQFILKEQYLKVRGLGDRLVLIKEQINWEPFRSLIASVFYDNKDIGGRPHTDELIVVRAMLLQNLYGLSDEELEFQCNDRLSFHNFLGFPEKVSDFTTIWKIRERLIEEGVEPKIWKELQRQLDQKGYTIKNGVMQDAAFIEAEFGRKWGGSHTENILGGLPAHIRGEKITKKALKELVNDRLLIPAMKTGEIHYSLNPEKADEILQFYEKYREG